MYMNLAALGVSNVILGFSIAQSQLIWIIAFALTVAGLSWAFGVNLYAFIKEQVERGNPRILRTKAIVKSVIVEYPPYGVRSGQFTIEASISRADQIASDFVINPNMFIGKEIILLEDGEVDRTARKS